MAQDTLKVDSISENHYPLLRPAIYIDYGKLLTLPFKFETKLEGGVELLIKNKIPLIAEVGYGKLRPESAYDTGFYESKGMYLRLGSGYFIQMNPKNKIGLTFRFAVAKFTEYAENITRDKGLPTELQWTKVDNRKDMLADWGELVIYSDKKINRFLSLGMNLRLRILFSYSKTSPDVHTIPGYGRTFDKTIPAVNLFVKIGL